jgi:hypothetical protein
MGHSAHLLWEGELHRVFISLLLTSGGWHFYTSLIMLAIGVGWVEIVHGSLVAMSTFVGIHLATVLLMSCGIALSAKLMESHRGHLLWYVRDVGPSAGYYGCLGMAIHSQGAILSWIAAGIILIILSVRLITSSYHLLDDGRTMSADVAHLIAFPIGLWVGSFMPKIISLSEFQS